MINMNKSDCEALGGEWVDEYRKSDGTIVKSYCRSPQRATQNAYRDEMEKRKELQANQQVILNQLLKSVRMLDLSDAQMTLENLGYAIESEGQSDPELYQAYKNSSPEFRKSLQALLNSNEVNEFSSLSPPRWGSLDKSDKEVGDEYNRAVRKFVKEWKRKNY